MEEHLPWVFIVDADECFSNTLVSTKKGNDRMIPQAFKRWLHKVFAWFSGRKSVEAEYAHVVTPLNKSMTQESASRTSSDVVTPQPGIAPRIVGQSEISCSTIDEWPERIVQQNPTPNEKLETPPPTPSTPVPITPTIESTTSVKEQPSSKNEARFPDAPPPTPTPEQQLEFLQYLVKRGIVNEGFSEGQVPDQYRKM